MPPHERVDGHASDKEAEVHALSVDISLRRLQTECKRSEWPAAHHRLTTETMPLIDERDFPNKLKRQEFADAAHATILVSYASWEENRGHRDAAIQWAARAAEFIGRPAKHVTSQGLRDQLKKLDQRLDKLVSDLAKPRTDVERVEFNQLLSRLETSVDQIRGIDNRSEASHQAALLQGMLNRLKDLQELVVPNFTIDLADGLRRQLEEHIDELYTVECRQLRAEVTEQLREVWPDDAEHEAEDEAYHLARICGSLSPASERAGWEELKRSFDRHNGVFYFQRAVDRARAFNGTDQPEVLDDLHAAVAHDPSLAPSAAVLVSLAAVPPIHQSNMQFRELRDRIIQFASRVVSFSDANDRVPPRVRDELAEIAQAEFRRVGLLLISIERIDSDCEHPPLGEATMMLRKIFRPVLEHGTLVNIQSVDDLAKQWREICESWYDPRHAYHWLQREIDVAVSLRNAHDVLMKADDPRKTDTHDPSPAALVTEAIEVGIPNRFQLERAVRLYAITVSLDGPQTQRAEVLRELMPVVSRELSQKDDESQTQHATRLAQIRVEKIARWIREAEVKVQPGTQGECFH